jgi:formylglycine-generating enzyme required for sulfatase activity
MNMKVFLRVFLALWTASAVAQSALPVPTNAPAGDTESTNEEAKPPGSDFTNSVGMELIKVGDFWAGKYEVTQKQYFKVAGINPSSFVGDDNPVDSISYGDAVAFCQKMTEQDIKEKKLPDGYYYTLPTEDEWETLTADAGLGDAITSQNGLRGGTSPVGSLAPNSLGLYDTRGNLMEFCLGSDDKPFRVLRGGSWSDRIEINLRKEFRFYCTPGDSKNTFGFRCLLKSK